MKKPEVGERWKYVGFTGVVLREKKTPEGSTWEVGSPSSDFTFYIHEIDLSRWEFLAPAVRPGQVWKKDEVFATIIKKEGGRWSAGTSPGPGNLTTVCIPEDDCAWEFVADPAQLGDQYLLEDTVWTVVGLNGGWVAISAPNGSRRDLRYGDLVQHGQRLPVAPHLYKPICRVGQVWRYSGMYFDGKDLVEGSVDCVVIAEASPSSYLNCLSFKSMFSLDTSIDNWQTKWTFVRDFVASKGDQYISPKNQVCTVKDIDLVRELVLLTGSFGQEAVPFKEFLGLFEPNTSMSEPAKPSRDDLRKAIEVEMETPPKGICRAAWVSYMSGCFEPVKGPAYTPEAVQAFASTERLAPSYELQALHQKHFKSKNWE